jgi:hypothetical protein
MQVTVTTKACKGVDGEKRQATLQVCLRARGSQPRPDIIFRGAGRFLKSERPLYDKVMMMLYVTYTVYKFILLNNSASCVLYIIYYNIRCLYNACAPVHKQKLANRYVSPSHITM